MLFDAKRHRSTIIIDSQLARGLAINAASVIGISIGNTVKNIVGSDISSLDGVNYPGVITSPLPILLASQEYISELQYITQQDNELYVMPFSALAQSCKTYDEYEQKISTTHSEALSLVAIGLIGPKKKITKLTGNLALFS